MTPLYDLGYPADVRIAWFFVDMTDKKYVFKPYSDLFPILFSDEKKRISSHLAKDFKIEHVGSTAVPGLGGKGIIDILISVSESSLLHVKELLGQIGYAFNPSFSTQERLYFTIDLPDSIEGRRRYHVHLTFRGSDDERFLIQFRDYLRSNPDKAREYEELKKRAVALAKGQGEIYRDIKDPFIKKALSQNDID